MPTSALHRPSMSFVHICTTRQTLIQINKNKPQKIYSTDNFPTSSKILFPPAAKKLLQKATTSQNAENN